MHLALGAADCGQYCPVLIEAQIIALEKAKTMFRCRR
jgi:hypothetical protein